MGEGMSTGATSRLLSPPDRWLLRLCVWVPLAALVLFFALPMLAVIWRSFVLDTGEAGFGNYIELVGSPGLLTATVNSLVLGVATTVVTIALALTVAYGLERTCMKGKRFARMALSLPVLAPSLVLGLGILFLLGRNGLVGRMLGIRMDIYGFWGLFLSDILFALPEAVLILRTALLRSDVRLSEAATVLGASSWRKVVDITIPEVRYSLLSAALVVFSLTMTDFGNAAVIGGDFSVLATEIYNQVNGQMRLGIGAVVGILLLAPTLLALWAQRLAGRREEAFASSSLRQEPTPSAWRDGAFSVVVGLVAASLLVVIATVVLASFIRLWPYSFELTLKNYDIEIPGGYESLWISFYTSVIAALIGIVLLFMLVFGIKHAPDRWQSRLANFLAVIPVGVPGLVLGLSYVFVFNDPASPLSILYGTSLLIALCNLYHYHTQAYVSLASAVRKIPVQLEDAATLLGASLWRNILDIYLPMIRQVAFMIAVFIFMRSMVTLAAVIFLVTPDIQLASTMVMRLDDAGLTAQAAAFSTCIMAIVGSISLGIYFLQRRT